MTVSVPATPTWTPPGATVPSPRGPRRAPERHRLDDMAGGWFVGSFAPVALGCTGAEVALKHVAAGTVEPRHVHHVAAEVTLVVSGRVRLGGHELGAGDILVVHPGTAAEFEAVADSTIVVVKTPSVPGDKFPATGA